MTNKTFKNQSFAPLPMKSLLSDFIINSRETESEFLLPTLASNDHNAITTKIYLF
jgi:hypothetical protein